MRVSKLLHAVGLQVLEQRVAVPRLQHLPDCVRPRRAGGPYHAQAEEDRHDRQPQIVALGHEVLHRGPHAVPRAALAEGDRLVGEAAGAHPLESREQAAALRDGMAMLLGDQVEREVGVAAAERPADVVDQEQGELAVRRALLDQPQLLADHVVVVVAVDDHGVRRRQLRDRRQARLAH